MEEISKFMQHIVRPNYKTSFALLLTIIIITGCDCGNEQPDAAMFTGKSKVYALHSVSNPAIEGIIKFAERRDDVTLVALYLKGISEENSHPAFIHTNSLEETGEVSITLNPVTGKNGVSETMVKQKNDGTPLDYDQLRELKGYVTVHLSQSDMETIIAQGNIGDQ